MFVVLGRDYLSGALYGVTLIVQSQASLIINFWLKIDVIFVEYYMVLYSYGQLTALPTNHCLVRYL
jgi:hypothetical protein